MSARSRRTCGRTRTSSTARSGSTCPVSRFARTCGSVQGAEIHPSASILGPALIGDNCRIGAGRRAARALRAGRERPRRRQQRHRALRHPRQRLHRLFGECPRLCDRRGPATCARACSSTTGLCSATGSRVGRQAVIGAGVKVYPHKIIEAGAVVNSSIIWESRGSRSLFGRLRRRGHRERRPLSRGRPARRPRVRDHASKGRHGRQLSRDSSRAARMLKRAAIVGIIAAGCNVEDLEAATVPVTRFLTRTGTDRRRDDRQARARRSAVGRACAS